MRLYEATGMGALLITDWKEDLTAMFEPNREVVCYRSPQEAVDLIRYFLAHEDERSRIAAAAQRRTLGEHTYNRRAAELVGHFQQRLRAGAR
jgi:spore maturation protein CgeB